LPKPNKPISCFGSYKRPEKTGVRKCNCGQISECKSALQSKILNLIVIRRKGKTVDIRIDLHTIPFIFTAKAVEKINILFQNHAFLIGCRSEISAHVAEFRLPKSEADEFIKEFTDLLSDLSNLEPLP